MKRECEEQADELCEECGRVMVKRHGRYGYFLGCTGFPECRNTKSVPRYSGTVRRDSKIPRRKSSGFVRTNLRRAAGRASYSLFKVRIPNKGSGFVRTNLRHATGRASYALFMVLISVILFIIFALLLG